MNKKPKYVSITAGISAQGEPRIIGFYKVGRKLSFDIIPMSDGMGNVITKITCFEIAPGGSAAFRVTEEKIIKCGCCCANHRVDYHGDCRNDAERFADLDDAAARLGKPVIEVFEDGGTSAHKPK